MAEKLGRPPVYQSKDEKPATVSLRIPRELYEQAQKYVRMRTPMTLTDLLLDGLRLRLETPADPRDLILSDDNTVIQELQEMVDAAVQKALAREMPAPPALDTPKPAPPPEAGAEPVPELSYNDNTVLQETEGTAPADAPEAIEAQIDQHITRLEHRVHEMQSRNGESTDTVPEIAHDNNTVLQEKAPKRSGRKSTLRQPIIDLLREHPEGLTAVQIKVHLGVDKNIGDTLAGMVRNHVIEKQGSGNGVRYLAVGAQPKDARERSQPKRRATSKAGVR